MYSTKAASITLCQKQKKSTALYQKTGTIFFDSWLITTIRLSWSQTQNDLNSLFTRQGKNRGRSKYLNVSVLHARPSLKICIGLAKAKVQGTSGLTAIPWQPRWESDVHSGRSLCVRPPANTGSLGTRHAPFNFTGHPHSALLSLSRSHTHTHTHTNTHTRWPLLHQPLMYGLEGLPVSHHCPRKPESLWLIRVIETGSPETKELLNCYPLAHLKDHLIKLLCVYVLFSLSHRSPPLFWHTFLCFFNFLNSVFLPGHCIGYGANATTCS